MILQGDSTQPWPFRDNSIDAIITDSPYGLGFMNRAWDIIDEKFHRAWLAEAIRVLKPGGSLLAMGGTRTFHRLACAMEDTGFIIKDTLMWLTAQGFPKAQELSTLIDAKILGISTKEVNGRRKIIGYKESCGYPDGNGIAIYKNRKKSEGTQVNTGGMPSITLPLTPEGKFWQNFKVGSIKPAWEPILWAIKSPEGSFASNVLKWGVGAVNVEETRIATNWNNDPTKRGWQGKSDCGWFKNKENQKENKNNCGRFPANVILDEEAARMLDEQSGQRNISGTARLGKINKAGKSIFGSCDNGYASLLPNDSGGASRFFYCAKASRREREMGMEGAEERCRFTGGLEGASIPLKGSPMPKARNFHPTVKPIALFEWLIKLVTRQGQTILDPFLGSGTTMIAAHKAGRRCIGIEKEWEYLGIAKRRVAYWQAQPVQLGIEKEA